MTSLCLPDMMSATLLALLFGGAVRGGAPPSLVLRPPLARLDDPDRPAPAQDFAILAMLDPPGGSTLNTLFGTSLPVAADSGTLHADLCAPLAAGSPALVCLAAQASPSPDASAPMLTALVLADVWLAALPSGSPADEQALDALLLNALELLSHIASHADQDVPWQLLVLVPAESEVGTGAELSARAGLLWEQRYQYSRSGQGSVSASESGEVQPPLYQLLELQVVRLPGDLDGDAGAAAGAQVLARFAQAERPDYLLRRQRRVPSGVGLGELPILLRALLRTDRWAESGRSDARNDAEKPHGAGSPAVGRDARSRGTQGHRRALLPHKGRRAPPAVEPRSMCIWDTAEWPAMARCELARLRVWRRASSAAAALAEEQAEEINPLPGFAGRLQALHDDATRSYEKEAGAWKSSRAFAEQAAALQRALTACLLTELRRHVCVLRSDAFESFQGDLAVTMATAVAYERAASRLLRKRLKKHGRTVGAAVPPALARYAPMLSRSSVRALDRQLASEVGSHVTEAAELPPVPEADGPVPWWKQLLTQFIGIGLNLVQAYFLQYLPARRKDLADERAVPRGPIF